MEETKKITYIYKVPAGVVIEFDGKRIPYIVRGPLHPNPTAEELIINELCEEIDILKKKYK